MVVLVFKESGFGRFRRRLRRRLWYYLRCWISFYLVGRWSGLWISILLLLLLYVAAIYLTQITVMTKNYPGADPAEMTEMTSFYRSVARSMLSLFEGLTGGLDWGTLVEPIIQHVSPMAGCGLVAYMAFAILAVMNVVTGTFVQNAIIRAEEVKDVQLAMRARLLFKTLDDDKSGVISMQEIDKHLEDAAVREYFNAIDVEPSEVKFLFEMLDINNSGSIDFDEFLNGCIRLQGPARALDLLLITRETRKAFERIYLLLRQNEAKLQVLGEEIIG